MAIFRSAKIKSNDKVNLTYEANSNNGVEKSAAHPQFSRLKVAISCSAKIHSEDKVDSNYEANSNNAVERSAARAQVSSVT